MSKQEIEKLLVDAINKLNALDESYSHQLTELKERIDFLEEMVSSQKNMLKDSVEYIRKIENGSTVNR
ncbi:hypothetical protein [Fulvivirga lutea]|uniref:Uncharacterized protein n=1 Tax=Fulvivirga lutea TaxID=2810512 RepID=A0A975A1N8_9BACT|nr:hypothetical protein [Fulvivirga lutea]QSE98526.1 hypothetical protein JR347_05445 [Fulvivirga lutea]